MKSIAEKYNISLDTLVKMNKQIADPSLIMPGMKIKVPMIQEKKEAAVREKEIRNNKEPIALDDTTKSSNVRNESTDRQKIDVSDRFLEIPHAQNEPKRLPQIKEDENSLPDKMMVPYNEESEEEIFNQAMLSTPVYNFNPYDSPTDGEQTDISEEDMRNVYQFPEINPTIEGPVPYEYNMSGVGQMYPDQTLYSTYPNQMWIQPQQSPYYNNYQNVYMNPYQFSGMNPYMNQPSPCGCGNYY